MKEFWDKIGSYKWIKNISDFDIPLDILKLLALLLKFNLECLNKKFIPIKDLISSFEMPINYLDIKKKNFFNDIIFLKEIFAQRHR